MKEGVGWRLKLAMRLVVEGPADAAERCGAYGCLPCTASPSNSNLVVAEGLMRRSAVSMADHDTAAAEAWSCGTTRPHPAINVACRAGGG